MSNKKFTVEYFTGIVTEVVKKEKFVILSVFNSRSKEAMRLRLSRYLSLESQNLIKSFGDLGEETMINKRYLFKFFEKGLHVISFEEIKKETRKEFIHEDIYNENIINIEEKSEENVENIQFDNFNEDFKIVNNEELEKLESEIENESTDNSFDISNNENKLTLAEVNERIESFKNRLYKKEKQIENF
ncbi:MAG: hypothetical protein AM1032_000374 [Mycoplasmataceae bacterium]|nr:MAG: hypothetical protein AM1032_000374 [Mycoplasmataceae bacterium]